MKVAIVLETYREGVSVADVARRHDISPPQLHAWHRAAREGLLPMQDDDALEFLPVSVSSGGDAEPYDRSAALTLEIGDVHLLVPSGFDARQRARVMLAGREAS